MKLNSSMKHYSKIQKVIYNLLQIIQTCVDYMPDGHNLPGSCRKTLRSKVTEAKHVADNLRNCDVGTPLQQSKRFYEFCCKYRALVEIPYTCWEKCPLKNNNDECCCQLMWAQLPYNKEE